MKYQAILVELVVKETDLAFLFRINDYDTWVPKSVCDDPEAIQEGDEETEVDIATWFVRQEELA